MESTRRYLLQAEIEFWHEMLRLNRSRLSEDAQKEMRSCLKKAMRDFNTRAESRQRIAA